MTFDFDPIFTLLFNTETICPMSIKIKVSLPLGIEEKQDFKIIILLLTIFDGIMGMHACNVITEARVGNSFANYPMHIQILYNTLFKTIIYYNFDNNSI
jgi:hypothetical protein